MSPFVFSRARTITSVTMAFLYALRTIEKSQRLRNKGCFLEAYELANHAADQFAQIVDGMRSRDIPQQWSDDDVDTVKAFIVGSSTGEILLQLGNYEKAIPALEVGARIYRNKYELNDRSDGNHKPLAALLVYRNLALAYKAIGDYPAACAALGHGLELYDSSLAGTKGEFAKVVGARLVGKYGKWVERDTRLVVARLEYADLNLLAGRRHEADCALTRVEGLIPRLSRKDRQETLSMVLLGKARIAQFDNRLDEAREILMKAAPRIAELEKNSKIELKSEESAFVASWLRQAAAIELARDDGIAAEDLYRRALRFLERSRPTESPIVAEVRSDLAHAMAANDKHEEAIHLLLDLCARESPLWQVLSVVSEAQRLCYLGRLKRDLDALLYLIEDARLGDVFGNKVFQVVLRRKGASFEADIAQREAVFSQRYPRLALSFEKLSVLRTSIGQKILAGVGPEGIDEHERVLAVWQQERQELEAEVMRMVPISDLTNALSVTVSDVRRALPDNGAFVEFYQYKDRAGLARYVAFVLQKKAESPAIFWLGNAISIDALIPVFRALLDGSLPSEQHSSAVLDEEKLAARLMPPLRAATRGATRLLIAPDAQLTGIPFELLPAGNDDLMGDRAQISYVTTGRDLSRLDRRGELSPDGGSVVVGAPDYDAVSPDNIAEEMIARLPMWFPSLDGTEKEATEIARILETTALVNKGAVKRVIRHGPAPRILHLATHGYAMADTTVTRAAVETDAMHGAQEYVLRSGLALAGANTWCLGGRPPDEAEDGLLSAEDVLTMDLYGTDLVTLSACETGIGFAVAGEGAFGLRRSFLIAGARSLVVSLWEVPDISTRRLMEEFYRQLLLGTSKLEELREAQAFVRRSYGHSVNWAGFILIGHPGPLAELAVSG